MDCFPLGTVYSPSLLWLTLARIRSIRRVWVYMFIGQTVAVSYASALFWAAREGSPVPLGKRVVHYASKRLVWTTIVATIISGVLYKSLTTPYYLILLLVVHVLLFPPLLEPHNATLSVISISQLYAINGILCVILHACNSVLLFKERRHDSIFRVIGEHPAMSSIGWDVICCVIIGVIGTHHIKSIALPLGISLGGTIGGILSIFSLDDKVDLNIIAT
jgi:hypothetical protein